MRAPFQSLVRARMRPIISVHSLSSRYHNRVHTGYDWNMYNKTHYDLQNPPPKTVQGYKFNIM